MYAAKCIIYYLDLVDTGTESVCQRQKKGVHVDSLLLVEVVQVRFLRWHGPFCADIWGNRQTETIWL